jgi:hypothetical protein
MAEGMTAWLPNINKDLIGIKALYFFVSCAGFIIPNMLFTARCGQAFIGCGLDIFPTSHVREHTFTITQLQILRYLVADRFRENLQILQQYLASSFFTPFLPIFLRQTGVSDVEVCHDFPNRIPKSLVSSHA